jgi:hypothetical protein
MKEDKFLYIGLNVESGVGKEPECDRIILIVGHDKVIRLQKETVAPPAIEIVQLLVFL